MVYKVIVGEEKKKILLNIEHRIMLRVGILLYIVDFYKSNITN